MAQIGLPTGGEPRTPLLETTTPDGKYRYVLYEWGVVAVQKPVAGIWKTEYVIRADICPCTGHQYRGTCKHVEVARKLQAYYAEHAVLPTLGNATLA